MDPSIYMSDPSLSISSAKGYLSFIIAHFSFSIQGQNQKLFLGSSGICLDGHLLAINTVANVGQGEVRGKVHLSHRRFVFAAWYVPRLRRR